MLDRRAPVLLYKPKTLPVIVIDNKHDSLAALRLLRVVGW